MQMHKFPLGIPHLGSQLTAGANPFYEYIPTSVLYFHVVWVNNQAKPLSECRLMLHKLIMYNDMYKIKI